MTCTCSTHKKRKKKVSHGPIILTFYKKLRLQSIRISELHLTEPKQCVFLPDKIFLDAIKVCWFLFDDTSKCGKWIQKWSGWMSIWLSWGWLGQFHYQAFFFFYFCCTEDDFFEHFLEKICWTTWPSMLLKSIGLESTGKLICHLKKMLLISRIQFNSEYFVLLE